MQTARADFDARLSRVEGIVEQLGQRLTTLETRVDQGFREVNARMDAGFRDLHTRLYWLIGIQFTTLVALGTLILVKL